MNNKKYCLSKIDFNKYDLWKIKKKNGACVFWAPVFFLSFLAGKFDAFERRLPWEFISENKFTQILVLI